MAEVDVTVNAGEVLAEAEPVTAAPNTKPPHDYAPTIPTTMPPEPRPKRAIKRPARYVNCIVDRVSSSVNNPVNCFRIMSSYTSIPTDKPYVCVPCRQMGRMKRYSRSNDLVRHLRTHHQLSTNYEGITRVNRRRL